MNTKITKKDVALYFAGKLDRSRRREIETACKTDAQVQRWFAQLTPTDEELEHAPLPIVAVDSPEYRRIAAMTYQSVERDEPILTVGDWFDSPTQAADVMGPWGVIPLKTLIGGRSGRLAYRAEVPLRLAADHSPPSMTPIEIPCIQPDFASGRLTIRQWPTDELAGGAVTVFAARKIAADQVERFGPVRVQMDRGQRMDGAPYWYKEIPIRSLVPNLDPKDEVVFYVEPAGHPDRPE